MRKLGAYVLSILAMYCSIAVSECAARPVTTRDLLNLTEVTLRRNHTLLLSPNARFVAFQIHRAQLQQNSYRVEWMVAPTDGRSPAIIIGDGGTPQWDPIGQMDPGSFAWSDDSKWLYYTVQRNGRVEVWRSSVNGGIRQQVTHHPSSILSFKLLANPLRLEFEAAPSATAIAKAKQIAEARGFLFDSTIQPWTGHASPPLAIANQVWIQELTTSSAERLATQQEREDYDRAQIFGSDLHVSEHGAGSGTITLYGWQSTKSVQGTLAFVSNRRLTDLTKPNGYALYIRRRGQNTVTPLTPETGAEIGDFWWSSDGGSIYFVQVTKFGSALRRVSINGGTPQDITDPAEDTVGCDVNSKKYIAVCIQGTNSTPPNIVAVDLRSRHISTLTNLNPSFLQRDLGVVKTLEWYNSYGDRTTARLVYPLHYVPGRRYPLIITTYRSHDFLEIQGGTGDEFPVQVFASKQFFVLAFDVEQIIGEYGGSFFASQRAATNDTLLTWASPVQSIEMEVNELAAQGLIDKRHVGMSGLSYGATLTDYAMSHSQFLAAAIRTAGEANNPFFYYLSSQIYGSVYRSAGIPSPTQPDPSNYWNQAATALNAERVQAPLLIQAADTEYLVSLDVYAELKARNKPVEMMIYPNELHEIMQPQHRFEIYNMNVDWFRFWLQGYEDPDPAKAAQYRRWEQLRKLQQANEAKTAAATNQ